MTMVGNVRLEPWNYSCDDCESIESKYSCPIPNCSKHGTELIKWVHGGGCNGNLRLYSNGKEKCVRCGKEQFFCLWDCSCADESKNNQKYSYQKLKNVLSITGGLDARSVSPYFLLYVGASIDKQYKDHPERFCD